MKEVKYQKKYDIMYKEVIFFNESYKKAKNHYHRRTRK